MGGTLSLMSDSLVFKPHAIDSALMGQSWQVHLSQIRAVGKEGANMGDFFSGGLASRLRIELVDGSVELFNVWGLDEVIQQITGYLAWFQQQGGALPGAQGAACQGCGAPLQAANKFCGQCGRPVAG